MRNNFFLAFAAAGAIIPLGSAFAQIAESGYSLPLTLVARFSQIEGYRCLSLTRAFGVVKCQLALV